MLSVYRLSFAVFLLLAAGALPAGAQRPYWDPGPIDLDGPLGPPPLPTTVNLLSSHLDGEDLDHWAIFDPRRTLSASFFQVEDFAGLTGYSPIFGAKSLWCGTRPVSEACRYPTPGYGNNWDERFMTRDCLSVTGFVSCTFSAAFDMDPPNDRLTIEYDLCDDNWTSLATLTGLSGNAFFGATIAPGQHSGSVRFRLRFVSDESGSDEDGLFDSHGAIIIDDLRIDDNNGPVIPYEQFESGVAPDWIADGGLFWNHGDVDFGYELVQEDPAVENLTLMWIFTRNSSATYACGGHPSQAAVPLGPIDGQYFHNRLQSEAINFTGPFAHSTRMRFDVYRDLPRDNLVFYTWRVRERLVGADCWGPWRGPDLLFDSERKEWHTHEADLTPYLSVSSVVDAIQIGLDVVDMAGAWTGIFGSGSCHSHAPMFDNIEVYRRAGRSTDARELMLLQDRFPDDGSQQGTVRVDAVEGDLLEVVIAEPSTGIDYLVPNTPSSGPAVLLNVKNIANKSGAIISGGQEWPYIANLSDANWTAIQMSTSDDSLEYAVDLNDNLYTPGDVVEYYISSRDMNGVWSYWSHFIGSTTSLAEVRQSPMEMTCLPRPPQQAGPRGLYIDACSGLGAQPLLEDAFGQLAVEWDRFDRNDPLQDLPNGLGNLLTNPAFFQMYDFVLWNTGDMEDPFRDEDYVAMVLYLDTTPGARLYISGDHAARAIASSPDPAAVLLRTQFLNFDLVTDDHRSLGLPLTPMVKAVPNGAFQGNFFAYGGDGTTFDVIAPTGGATIAMYYGDSINWGALIHQDAFGQAGLVKTALATFSIHWIRDDKVQGLTDRTMHLDQVLQFFGTPGGPATGAGSARGDMLAQNHPNPFNPSTTIEYALSRPGAVTLRIYDVSGSLVRTLADDDRAPAGPARVVWDGRDNAGNPVASGVYFCRLAASGYSATHKMVLLK